MAIKNLSFFCMLILSGYASGQLLPNKELPYLMHNRTAMEELYQLRGMVKSVRFTVTEFQTVTAVNSPNKKHTYDINLTIDRKLKSITEVSDKNKPNFRIRNVYSIVDDDKSKSRKCYDDNLDGKGWQLNEEFVYGYKKDKHGNYYNELVRSTDPRPGSDVLALPKVKALYNFKNKLVSYTDSTIGSCTFQYSYNSQGDVISEKIDCGTDDSHGEMFYKYTYDPKGNCIKKETHRTTRFMKNVLDEISFRSIVYKK